MSTRKLHSRSIQYVQPFILRQSTLDPVAPLQHHMLKRKNTMNGEDKLRSSNLRNYAGESFRVYECH